jgi:hypothetical protein
VLHSTLVKAVSNTSTVTLRVVGGDEKGSLNSETVKIWSRVPRDSGPRKTTHIQKTDPSSRQKGCPTKMMGLDAKIY